MEQLYKIIFTVSLFFLFTTNLFSQWSVSGYSAAYPKIGVAHNFSDRWWAELRVMSRVHVFDFNPELMMNYNFIKAERYNTYFGAGISLNAITGFVFPLGVQFFPFPQNNKFSLHIELESTIIKDAFVLVQPSWGVRYRF